MMSVQWVESETTADKLCMQGQQEHILMIKEGLFSHHGNREHKKMEMKGLCQISHSRLAHLSFSPSIKSSPVATNPSSLAPAAQALGSSKPKIKYRNMPRRAHVSLCVCMCVHVL